MLLISNKEVGRLIKHKSKSLLIWGIGALILSITFQLLIITSAHDYHQSIQNHIPVQSNALNGYLRTTLLKFDDFPLQRSTPCHSVTTPSQTLNEHSSNSYITSSHRHYVTALFSILEPHINRTNQQSPLLENSNPLRFMKKPQHVSPF